MNAAIRRHVSGGARHRRSGVAFLLQELRRGEEVYQARRFDLLTSARPRQADGWTGMRLRSQFALHPWRTAQHTNWQHTKLPSFQSYTAMAAERVTSCRIASAAVSVRCEPRRTLGLVQLRRPFQYARDPNTVQSARRRWERQKSRLQATR